MPALASTNELSVADLDDVRRGQLRVDEQSSRTVAGRAAKWKACDKRQEPFVAQRERWLRLGIKHFALHNSITNFFSTRKLEVDDVADTHRFERCKMRVTVSGDDSVTGGSRLSSGCDMAWSECQRPATSLGQHVQVHFARGNAQTSDGPEVGIGPWADALLAIQRPLPRSMHEFLGEPGFGMYVTARAKEPQTGNQQGDAQESTRIQACDSGR